MGSSCSALLAASPAAAAARAAVAIAAASALLWTLLLQPAAAGTWHQMLQLGSMQQGDPGRCRSPAAPASRSPAAAAPRRGWRPGAAPPAASGSGRCQPPSNCRQLPAGCRWRPKADGTLVATTGICAVSAVGAGAAPEAGCGWAAAAGQIGWLGTSFAAGAAAASEELRSCWATQQPRHSHGLLLLLFWLCQGP